MPIQTVGDCIRAQREARQWSLRDLEDRSGLSRKLISRYECHSIRNIPSNSIIALAKAFGIEPGALYPRRRPARSTSSGVPDEVARV
jgi:transcriptional regulator with XRE-family HTH domain